MISGGLTHLFCCCCCVAKTNVSDSVTKSFVTLEAIKWLLQFWLSSSSKCCSTLVSPSPSSFNFTEEANFYDDFTYHANCSFSNQTMIFCISKQIFYFVHLLLMKQNKSVATSILHFRLFRMRSCFLPVSACRVKTKFGRGNML